MIKQISLIQFEDCNSGIETIRLNGIYYLHGIETYTYTRMMEDEDGDEYEGEEDEESYVISRSLDNPRYIFIPTEGSRCREIIVPVPFDNENKIAI